MQLVDAQVQPDSWVESPLLIADPDGMAWRQSADVVVVGFGGAGACAALEAAAAGADTLLVERFDGGGATALSGGVVYAGATRFQREARIDDTPQEMFKYLKLETRGCVSDATLMKFCRDSSDNLEWLIANGARFSGRLDPRSCSYPDAGRFLYFSGNELSSAAVREAKPAPRGHRHVGNGMTGRYLFAALREAVSTNRAIRVATHSPVARLVTDCAGAVVGVEVNEIPPGSKDWKEHRRLIKRVNRGLWYMTDRTLDIAARLLEIERRCGARRLIRARRAVILATGGFAYNPAMMERYAPQFRGVKPLGTVGCDGSGIRLGESVGGQAERLGTLGVAINIKLSQAYERGIVVDAEGRRFCREDCYGSVLGRAVAERGGKAWLITDRTLHARVLSEVMAFWKKPLFELMPLTMGLYRTRKGRTLRELAARCNLPAATLEQTVVDYNTGVASTQGDKFGKEPRHLHALLRAPFYALDVSIDDDVVPGLALTLGGLLLDEATGQVLGRQANPIPGLYAAGRAAYGIPSNWLISGTTLADVVFSGRRAGFHAASAPPVHTRAHAL